MGKGGRDLFGTFPYIMADGIVIRQMTAEDADALFEILSNDHIFRYTPDFLHIEEKRVMEEIITWMSGTCFTKRRWIFAGICLLDDPGRVVGTAEMFDYNAKVNSVEIGYRINEGYWGRGIASRAVGAVTDYLFEEIGLNRIQATVLPENTVSKKVLLKNGFQKEGLLRQVSCWEGKGIVDLEMYSILRGDRGGSAGEQEREQRI